MSLTEVAERPAKALVTPGVKVHFSERKGERVIVFSDRPGVLAVIPNGTTIRMQAPVLLNGGAHVEYTKRMEGQPDLSADRVSDVVVTYHYGVLDFPNNHSVQVSDLKLSNWGTVVEVPNVD
jgi:hypothetical protein